MNFDNYFIHCAYAKVHSLGNRLGDVKELIDWTQFVPLISPLYHDNRTTGGRPHTDEIVLLKMLVIQQWYNLSDYALERDCTDRISFRHFLDYPEKIPDRTTIWNFRERLIDHGVEELIWLELQRQLDACELRITRGVMQDATFITADPGHAPAEKERGEKAQTRRSKDGTWAKKGSKSYFGYKAHILVDKENILIRRIETTTAKTHDSQKDLSEEGETVYRDKGYFGVKPKASMDKTMRRAVKNKPLSEKDKRRNTAISRTRSLVEYPFAVIKRTFHGGHQLVTTVKRIHVKNIFSCFAYNMYRTYTIFNQARQELSGGHM
jgi:IS5 family transposase